MIDTLDIIKDYFKGAKHEVYEVADDEYIVLCDKDMNVGDHNIHVLPFSHKATIELQYKKLYTHNKVDKSERILETINKLGYQFIVVLSVLTMVFPQNSWRTEAKDGVFIVAIDTPSGVFFTNVPVSDEHLFDHLMIDDDLPKKSIPIEHLFYLV